jgi:hypothetical protein
MLDGRTESPSYILGAKTTAEKNSEPRQAGCVYLLFESVERDALPSFRGTSCTSARRFRLTANGAWHAKACLQRGVPPERRRSASETPDHGLDDLREPGVLRTPGSARVERRHSAGIPAECRQPAPGSSTGPFVYRQGSRPFKPGRGVQFPYGLLDAREVRWCNRSMATTRRGGQCKSGPGTSFERHSRSRDASYRSAPRNGAPCQSRKSDLRSWRRACS